MITLLFERREKLDLKKKVHVLDVSSMQLVDCGTEVLLRERNLICKTGLVS